MVEEVMILIKKYSPDLPAMSSIGCKEVIPYLEGKLSKSEMIRTLQQNNRHFAKRQLTWFKKDPEYHWIEGTSVPFLK
jgi:tRNA dimethylallyltransferase